MPGRGLAGELTGGVELKPASIREALGDETAAFTGKSNGAAIFTVAWRYENLLGFCASGGVLATSPDETVAVAQAQHDRFENALR